MRRPMMVERDVVLREGNTRAVDLTCGEVTWFVVVTSTCATLACKSARSARVNDRAVDEGRQTTGVRTDVSGLERLIDLPKNVARVRWERTQKHGDSSLVAVAWLSRSDVEPLIRESPKLDVQSPVTIPRELLDAHETESHPSSQWRGVSIEPRAFANPKKSGLLNGFAVVVADSGFVYVALYEL